MKFHLLPIYQTCMDIAKLILSIESKRIMLIITTFHTLQLFQKINLLDLCALKNQLKQRIFYFLFKNLIKIFKII